MIIVYNGYIFWNRLICMCTYIIFIHISSYHSRSEVAHNSLWGWCQLFTCQYTKQPWVSCDVGPNGSWVNTNLQICSLWRYFGNLVVGDISWFTPTIVPGSKLSPAIMHFNSMFIFPQASPNYLNLLGLNADISQEVSHVQFYPFYPIHI